MIRVKDICNFLNEIMPFSYAESWDNSGLLAGDPEAEVTSVMTCLDITAAAAEEAAELGAQLVVSHHPVIFDPLKKITAGDPVYKLIRNGVSAICSHTCADAAGCGTNGIVYELLKDKLSLGEKTFIEPVGEDAGVGWICGCAPIMPDVLAGKLREVFGGRIKYTSAEKPITKLGFCSGSGGSLAGFAAESGCGGYITGDVKHDVFVFAENRGLSLFDCGHYETEIFFAGKTAEYISDRFPALNVFVSKAGKDYIRYL